MNTLKSLYNKLYIEDRVSMEPHATSTEVRLTRM